LARRNPLAAHQFGRDESYNGHLSHVAIRSRMTDAGEKVDFLAGVVLLGVLIRLIWSGYRICGLRLLNDLDVDATG